MLHAVASFLCHIRRIVSSGSYPLRIRSWVLIGGTDMARWVMAAVFAVAFVVSRGAAAEDHFVTPEVLDLRLILIGPPAQTSPQTMAEIEELRTIQRTRTEAQAAAARADAEETVFRFADVMGASFTRERLPRIAALFAILVEDE